MSKALIAGINQVATDKGLDREVIFEAIEAALISAYKRNYGSVANVSAEVDRVSGEMRVFAEREVVDEVFNLRTEITEEDARSVYPEVKLGDVIKVESKPDDFGRIAAQTAKQVILQRIREAERDTVYENFAHRVGEIINAQVRSIDAASGAVTILLDDKHECLMMREDQIARERLRRGDYVRVYIVDVHRSTRGPVIKISRTHRNLLRRLMEQEIPEIRDGIVEIKAIAREPGARSKAAVVATVPGVDPVGSCVGMRGLRIQNIVNELAGEKIDVVEWSTDLYTYISNALSPAKVTDVLLDEKSNLKTAIVVVPDRQLSLAIGKEGQNARLAAKLTGWRIDIKSESEAATEGLDRLIEEQRLKRASMAHGVQARGGDLMSLAEDILRSREGSTVADDLFSQAAKAVQSQQPEMPGELANVMGAGMDDEGTDVQLPLENIGETSDEKHDIFAEAAAAVQAEDASTPKKGGDLNELGLVEEMSFFDQLADSSMPDLPVTQEDEETPEEEPEQKALPEVITGDMLRERMKERKKVKDFEIPAELLVGLEEAELELDDEEVKSKSKGKKAKAKKGGKADKRSRRKEEWEEDFDDFV